MNQRRVVFDCSNGVGGIPLPYILPHFNLNAIVINEKPAGAFPHHGCDQTKPENFVQLQREVIQQRADLGVIFDGDADRCSFVDEKGNIVPLDMVFLILTLKECEKNKIDGPEALFDLRFSRSVAETLIAHFITPRIMRVGNPFYKKIMHENKKALVAGELSGHIMYNEDFAIDDALFASMKMIELISNSDFKLSGMVKKYKKYHSSGEISMKVNNGKRIMKVIEMKYEKDGLSKLDGISIDRGKVWFNVRPSNTEPLIRFDVEGLNEKIVEKQKKEIINLIKKNDKK